VADEPTATALLARAQRNLNAAHAALDGTTSLPPRRRTRAAAVFARSALEHVVDAALVAQGHRLVDAGMRARLICLRTLIDEDAGRTAAIAWAGLSQGCHHHAYELSPTWIETHHLVGLVGRVADTLTDSDMR
jgi:hypothetical protein